MILKEFFRASSIFLKSVVDQNEQQLVPIEGSKGNNITYEKA